MFPGISGQHLSRNAPCPEIEAVPPAPRSALGAGRGVAVIVSMEERTDGRANIAARREEHRLQPRPAEDESPDQDCDQK